MFQPPAADCPLCPRLCAFRYENSRAYPNYHNAPVPSFGKIEARILIVGLAPGLQGANATGRPFTNDYAGDLLYATLLKFGLARGEYACRADDGLELIDCRITNAVRCVPPQNKPTPAEQATCRPFLQNEIAAMPNLRHILALGSIAHQAVLDCFGLKKSRFKFGHGAKHAISDKITLFDSYHCSRYNTNTKRLTTEMFEAVIAQL
jgi:uracil-DNA glycosylase family 4